MRDLRTLAEAIPQEAVAMLSAALDQAALDGSHEARIVEFDREIPRSGLAGGRFPGCADLEAGFPGEDPEVRSLVAALALDRLEFHFRLECEGLDVARVAVFRRL